MRRKALLLALVVAMHPAPGRGQGNPLGPEFRVNTTTSSAEKLPAVAADSAGGFIAVWQTFQDGSFEGVFGQRFADSGVPLGPEFRVNTFITHYQRRAAVAADAAGGFVVTWSSFSQDGSSEGVFGQRYAGSGSPLGPEFPVNTFTIGYQTFPSVASDSSGNFVVVWTSDGQDGSSQGIYGQRYASTGTPLGPEFRVNTYITGSQRYPAVAASGPGDFVVVWEDQTQDGYFWGLFGQRYAATGVPLGPEFRVNAFTPGSQHAPAVAADGGGNFVVAWRGAGPGGLGIFAQRFAGTGGPLGPEFRVDTNVNGTLIAPVVASDVGGSFIIAWPSYGQDGAQYGVFGQRFAGSGSPLGAEFRINTYTSGQQHSPAVAAGSAGNFVVLWSSAPQDGFFEGVFGQRYAPILPAELTSFTID